MSKPIKIKKVEAERIALYNPLFDTEGWRRFCRRVNEPRQADA